VAGGDGIAEGIGALGPVGEAANFVTDAGVHEEIITFEFCGERGDRKRDSSLRLPAGRLEMTAVCDLSREQPLLKMKAPESKTGLHGGNTLRWRVTCVGEARMNRVDIR
jgi:hypothetical protein